MPVPSIALYASPPSSVCSKPHQINPHHASHDLDLNTRSPSSSPPTATSSQKPTVGGLSCLFSSPTVKHSSSSSFSNANEETMPLWHDRGDELSSSFRYSSLGSIGSSMKRDHQSPVSVFQGPVSCSISPPMRMAREKNVGDIYLQGPVRVGSSGLWNGFVRHGLGSCLDYDSPTFQAHGVSFDVDSPPVMVDDLPFDMEGGCDTMEMGVDDYAKDLLLAVQLKHDIFRDEFVVKAFYEAEKAHRGQMRASGDPYLQHCLETAFLLATIGANSTVVAAGLLHDTIDDCSTTYDYIFQTFGAGVADLVEGVSKLSQLSKLARENNIASETGEADRLHTMFLAMADARAVLIKLADRLHNMRTLDALPLMKQQIFAKETLEVFAPLANRLGIYSWKEQLESLCFKHIHPDQHEELSDKVVKFFDEAMITSAVAKLEQALDDAAVTYHMLTGRHKSLYSIYKKMFKKKLTMDEIHDIHGLRLIVDKEEDCYKALEVVRKLWSEVPGKFKDYINRPKCNGYQSLHTVVTGEGMVPLEVQIRTKDMHLQAEFGFAAHWRYKENNCELSSFVLQMVEWARWVVTWQCETMSKDRSIGCVDSLKPPCKFPSHSEDCPYSYKPNSGPDGPVFVIMVENNKMSVQEFPANSTIVDVMQRAGQGESFRRTNFPLKEVLRPRLNHEPVSDPSHKLKMGDVVELTPAIPDKSLIEYREEMQRMYDRGLVVASSVSSGVGWRS